MLLSYDPDILNKSLTLLKTISTYYYTKKNLNNQELKIIKNSL